MIRNGLPGDHCQLLSHVNGHGLFVEYSPSYQLFSQGLWLHVHYALRHNPEVGEEVLELLEPVGCHDVGASCQPLCKVFEFFVFVDQRVVPYSVHLSDSEVLES